MTGVVVPLTNGRPAQSGALEGEELIPEIDTLLIGAPPPLVIGIRSWARIGPDDRRELQRVRRASSCCTGGVM